MALIINGITLESSRIPATGTLQNEADLNVVKTNFIYLDRC